MDSDSTSTVTAIPKLRTYAHDLDEHRTKTKPAKSTVATRKVLTKPTTIKNKPGTVVNLKVPPIDENKLLPPGHKIEPVVSKKVIPVPIITPPPVSKKTAAKVIVPINQRDTSTLVTTHQTVQAAAAIHKSTSTLQATVTNNIKTTTASQNGRDNSYNATVIRDTKHNRFHLGRAIIQSIIGWLQSRRDQYVERKKPKYAVPQVDRRKGIIQKATSNTGRDSMSDHAAVLEWIRANKPTREQSDASKNLAPQPTRISNVTVQTRTTSHQTPAESEEDEGTDVIAKTPAPVVPTVLPPPPTPVPSPTRPVIQAPVIIPVVQTIVPIIPTATKAVEEVSLPSNETTPVETPQLESKPTTPVVPIRLLPDQIEPILPKQTDLTERDVTHVPYVKDTPKKLILAYISELPTLIHNQIDKQRQQALALVHSFSPIQNPNQLVFAVLVIITLGMIGYIGVRTMLTSATPLVKVTTTPTLFNPAVIQRETLNGTTKEKIIAQLLAKKTAEESLTEVIFVTPKDNTEIPANILISLFGFSLSPNFSASLKRITPGYYRGEPWLVITATDQTTAQGGMLQWETSLSNDLAPWFGPTVTPIKMNSLTGYKDGSIANVDIRTLRDSSDTERITYGFLDPNTILITTNTTAFLNLATHFVHP